MKTIVEYLVNNHITKPLVDTIEDGDYFVVDFGGDNDAFFKPAKLMGKFERWFMRDGKEGKINTYFQINLGNNNISDVYKNRICTSYNIINDLRLPTDDELEILEKIDKYNNSLHTSDKNVLIGRYNHETGLFTKADL